MLKRRHILAPFLAPVVAASAVLQADVQSPTPPARNIGVFRQVGCEIPGDMDCDGDTDIHDFALFHGCVSGPDVPYSQGCDLADLDIDGDVDRTDFAVFQRSFTGPGPWQKLIGAEVDQLDLFGDAVSVSGDVAIVGAWNDEGSGEPGVFAVGAAYVFRLDGDIWVQDGRLTAPDGVTEDVFGFAVSISGNVAVVGTPLDDDACPENPLCDSGSAYVFRFDNNEWTMEQKLTASDHDGNDQFGLTVGVSGDVIVVGSPREDEACGGEPGCNAGAAYVYRYNQKTKFWDEEQKLTAFDADFQDVFAASVSISGETVIASAHNDDDDGVSSGSAHVFRYHADTEQWLHEQKLTASDAELGDWFGRAVAINTDLIIVGAIFDDEACPKDPLCNSGSAYVFRRTGPPELPWIEEGKLTASDAVPDDEFGLAISISGDIAVVGVRWHDQAGIDSGSVYVYRFNANTAGWSEHQELIAFDADTRDRFGASVSVDGQVLLIGSPGEDEGGNGSGSAYIYKLSSE